MKSGVSTIPVGTSIGSPSSDLSLTVRAMVCTSALLGGTFPFATHAELNDGEKFQLSVSDRYTYEDNIYRLADSEQIGDLPLGVGASRDDYINRVSVGVEGAWQLWRQQFQLVGQMNDSQYQNNTDLDNTSGNARGNWDWRVGDNLSGQLGADYNRFLAGFENSRFLEKDVLETFGTFWNAMLRIGPHWRLKTSARHAEIEHGAEIRKFDNSETDSGTFGVHYETALGNTFGWDYRYSEARFKRPATLNGQRFDRNFDEHTTAFSTEYVLGPKTALKGSVGYVRREYANAVASNLARGSFSGGIWDAALKWQMTGKTAIHFNGWRKLRAYLDAETDYFVAKGGSIEPVWNPTAKISVRLEYSIEDQDYLGPSINVGVLGPRSDQVESQQISIVYSPMHLLQFSLSGRNERRDSDRPPLRYDGNTASIGVRLNY